MLLFLFLLLFLLFLLSLSLLVAVVVVWPSDNGFSLPSCSLPFPFPSLSLPFLPWFPFLHPFPLPLPAACLHSIYKSVHPPFFFFWVVAGEMTARMASSNTDLRFFWVRAEHSMYL